MYTNFEKEKLGKTFQYYRHKNNVKWKEIMSNSYISKNTYSRMSLGHILNDDSYYDEFIRFFNLRYNNTIHFENWLSEYLLRLNKSLEYCDMIEIEKLYKEFHVNMDEYKNYPIYEQYFICLDHIFRYYYENRYIDQQELEIDIILIKSNLYDDVLSTYLLEVMYLSNNNSIGDDLLRNKISNLMLNYKNPISSFICALNDKCERKLNSALDKFTQLNKYWKSKNNNYRYIKSLNGMFMIYKNIDKNKSLELIKEFENIKKTNCIPKSLLKSINYNIAMYYYVNKYFEEAYPIFIENIEQFDGIQDMVLLGYICTQLDKDIPNCFEKVDYSQSTYKPYINYYKMKKNGRSNDELVDYIMSVLLYDQLSKDEYMDPMWTIFEFELFKLLEKSKKYYRHYIEFRKVREKIVKFD